MWRAPYPITNPPSATLGPDTEVAEKRCPTNRPQTNPDFVVNAQLRDLLDLRGEETESDSHGLTADSFSSKIWAFQEWHQFCD